MGDILNRKDVIMAVQFILFLSILGSGFAACPTNWTSNAGSCYHFSHDYEPWLSAMLVCKMWDSNLVTIESPAEQIFVQQSATQSQVGGYWLGGSDLDIEGTFVWQADGAVKQISFENWAPNEPNNRHKDENCMYMKRDTHYTWTDEDCSDKHHYAC